MRRLALILALLAGTAAAAPAPWGIAVNQGAGECAGYWPGDEYVAYGLPEGWNQYMPSYGKDGATVATESGSCTFEYGREEECCRQLGLRYVAKNIGSEEWVVVRDRDLGGLPSGVKWAAAAAAALAACALLAILLAAAYIVLGKRAARNRPQ